MMNLSQQVLEDGVLDPETTVISLFHLLCTMLAQLKCSGMLRLGLMLGPIFTLLVETRLAWAIQLRGEICMMLITEKRC